MSSLARRNAKRRRNSRGATTGTGSAATKLRTVERELTRLRKEQTQHTQWAQTLENAGGGATGINLPNGEFYVNALVRPAGWSPIFQANSASGGALNAFGPNKARLNHFDIDLVFSPESSLEALSPRIVRVWVMQLRADTAMDTLSGTDGMSNLGLNAVSTGDKAGFFTHITTTDGGLATMVKFNPAMYRCKGYREFTLANIIQETAEPEGDTAVTNTADALKRVRMHVPVDLELKAGQNSWRGLTESEIRAGSRHYLIVHVGGWGGNPLVSINGVRMDSNITADVTVAI